MANRKVVQIFLASPRDLADERRIAKNVVDNFNRQWADFFGIQVELVGWEDSVTQFGRPQEIINRELDRCEVFIGMLWRRWGSPPDNEGKYTSGFEEEFERALASRKSSGRPQINQFFKKVDDDLLKDPGEDLKKVVDFRERLISEKQILFGEFTDAREFEERIGTCITRYVQQLKRDEAQQNKEDVKGKTADEPAEPQEQTGHTYNPLSAEGSQFIRELAEKSEHRRPADGPLSAVEVARLRLISVMVGSGSNDTNPLGTHDANLLFAQRDNISFSYSERRALVESGLEHLNHETVPLWHWYKFNDLYKSRDLSLFSLIGTQGERIGALKAMRLIGAPIIPIPPIPGDENTGISRNAFISSWLNTTADQVKIAGLEYLASWGEEADIELVRQELEKGNYQTKAVATDAIIRLNLRQSREKAVRALFELQPETVDPELLDAIFAKPASLLTELLLEGVSHRSGKVRAAVVSILTKRNGIEPVVAEKLIADTDAKVRFEALNVLIANGREYPDDKARSVLVKPTRNATGFGALFGFGGLPASDPEGEENWNQFSRAKLHAMPVASLERLAAGSTVLDQSARFALDHKRFKKNASTLRASIDDKFKTEFDSELAVLEKRLGNSDTVTRVKTIEESVRKELTRKATDILIEMGEPDDLTRIRNIVREGFVDFTVGDVAYLGRNGEWDDIPLLLSLNDRREPGASLLSGIYDTDKMDAIASAVYSIGKGRFVELSEFNMPPSIKSRIITLAKDAEISSLSDTQLFSLFDAKAEEIRKAILLRAVKSLSKRRLTTLLRDYMNREGAHFYNVIYWLDLGVSLTKTEIQNVVDQSSRKKR